MNYFEQRDKNRELGIDSLTGQVADTVTRLWEPGTELKVTKKAGTLHEISGPSDSAILVRAKSRKVIVGGLTRRGYIVK